MFYNGIIKNEQDYSFVYEVFSLCKQIGINTCLDTSGSVINDSVKKLLTVTDRVLLDIKYTSDKLYLDNIGCRLTSVLDFLKELQKHNIPTTLRQVIIPSLNDNKESILKLKSIAENHPCVDKIELLPFRKICQVKYDNMGLDFPFADILEPDKKTMDFLSELL